MVDGGVVPKPGMYLYNYRYGVKCGAINSRTCEECRTRNEPKAHEREVCAEEGGDV